jgi:lysophospholipase L1-like esterase
MNVRAWAVCLLLIGLAQVHAGAPAPFTVKEGDRVLFLGGGFVENDQWHAFFETRLQMRFPKVIFRYMGWSGDTVRGVARTAGYQVPQGLARLEKETAAQRPTVIFLSYGMNESFEGPQALAGFLQDYDKLLKTLAPLKARLVILSPTCHEDLGRPFPEPTEHNQVLRDTTKALQAFAKEHKLPFVDLFHALEAAKKADPALCLTTNGILLTKTGYALAGRGAAEQLGLPPARWEVHLDQSGKVAKSDGTRIARVNVLEGAVRFEATDESLPLANSGEVLKLRVTGLSPGEHVLKIDGQEVAKAPADRWQEGVSVASGPMFDDGEKLRAAVVLRNQLFYRRWRPYNDHSRHWTYIGADYKLYDQEIAAQEQRIAELRTPRPRNYQLTLRKR